MTNLPMLPNLPDLTQQAQQQTSTAGAAVTGIMDALTYDPLAGAVDSKLLNLVFIVGGLGLILIGFFEFRQVQSVVLMAGKKAMEAAA